MVLLLVLLLSHPTDQQVILQVISSGDGSGYGRVKVLKMCKLRTSPYLKSATGSSGSEDVEGSSNGLVTGRGLSVGRSGPSRPPIPGIRPKRTDRPEDDDSVFLPSKGKIPATALSTKSRDD